MSQQVHAGPSTPLECRLSQTEFGQDLEVGSYEQVSDRLPSVSESELVEDSFRLEVSEDQPVGPLTRSKKRKLESDSSPEIKKVKKEDTKTKGRRHRKHHHRSKHHKQKRPRSGIITID